jgi:hypothetical protein
MAIEGDLSDIDVSSMVQVLCTERRSLAVFMRRRGEEAVLHFDRGEIVHAAFGELQGEEAMYRLLAWKDGTFRITSGAAVPVQTIRRDWDQLLFEGMSKLGLNGGKHTQSVVFV